MFPYDTLGGLLEVLNERRGSTTSVKKTAAIDRAIREVDGMIKHGIDYRASWIVLVCLEEGGILDNE